MGNYNSNLRNGYEHDRKRVNVERVVRGRTWGPGASFPQTEERRCKKENTV